MTNEEDESRGVEHLPQSELEASPGLSTTQTSIDIDKLQSAEATNPTPDSDNVEGEQKLHFKQQPDESRGVEHLPHQN